jgi:hypothetical protein
MTLKEDTSLVDLQEHYEKFGCVVELCGFDIIDAEQTDYEISLNASVQAMNIFKERYENSWKRNNPNLDIKQYFYIDIYEDILPKGKKITLAEFFGEGYHFETNYIDLFNYSKDVRSSKTDMKGLSHALLDPPYSLRLMDSDKKFSVQYGREEQEKMTSLFKDFLKNVLHINDLNNNTFEIYEWSNDWSNYFDAGKEWWGTFYWSILNKTKNKITIIAASTTD